MDDDEVMRTLETRRKERCERYGILSEKFPHLVKELKKPGVTLELLWQEYQKQYPQGYSYSLVPLSLSGMAWLIFCEYAP